MKTVLLITPKFYFYSSSIVNSLERKGYKVLYYPERIYGVLYLVLKYTNLLNLFSRIRYNKMLSNIDINVDILFVIKGDTMPLAFLRNFELKFPKSKKIMYQWDSKCNFNYTKYISKFNKVYSFDRLDCISDVNLKYLPLFYTEKNQTAESKYKWELAFVSTFSTDRYAFLKQLIEYCNENDLRLFYYLYITRFNYFCLKFFKFFRFDKKIKLSFTPLNKNELESAYSNSFSFVDFNNKSQSGLSMRVVEAIGNKKKIITTNKDILHSKYYNGNNIAVLGDFIKINPCFFITDVEPYQNSDELYIDNWINTIVDV